MFRSLTLALGVTTCLSGADLQALNNKSVDEQKERRAIQKKLPVVKPEHIKPMFKKIAAAKKVYFPLSSPTLSLRAHQIALARHKIMLEKARAHQKVVAQKAQAQRKAMLERVRAQKLAIALRLQAQRKAHALRVQAQQKAIALRIQTQQRAHALRVQAQKKAIALRLQAQQKAVLAKKAQAQKIALALRLQAQQRANLKKSPVNLFVNRAKLPAVKPIQTNEKDFVFKNFMNRFKSMNQQAANIFINMMDQFLVQAKQEVNAKKPALVKVEPILVKPKPHVRAVVVPQRTAEVVKLNVAKLPDPISIKNVTVQPVTLGIVEAPAQDIKTIIQSRTPSPAEQFVEKAQPVVDSIIQPQPSLFVEVAKTTQPAAVQNQLVSDRFDQVEVDRQAQVEAARQAQLEADRLAQVEADRLAQVEADRQAQVEADRVAQVEADRVAQVESDRLAQVEADRVAQVAADSVAQAEADRVAQAEADRVAQAEADRVAQVESDRLAQVEADRVAKIEADRQAQVEADRQAQVEADRQAQVEADRQAQVEADRVAKVEADRQAQVEADRLAQVEADTKAAALEAEKQTLRADAQSLLDQIKPFLDTILNKKGEPDYQVLGADLQLFRNKDTILSLKTALWRINDILANNGVLKSTHTRGECEINSDEIHELIHGKVLEEYFIEVFGQLNHPIDFNSFNNRDGLNALNENLAYLTGFLSKKVKHYNNLKENTNSNLKSLAELIRGVNLSHVDESKLNLPQEELSSFMQNISVLTYYLEHRSAPSNVKWGEELGKRLNNLSTILNKSLEKEERSYQIMVPLKQVIDDINHHKDIFTSLAKQTAEVEAQKQKMAQHASNLKSNLGESKPMIESVIAKLTQDPLLKVDGLNVTVNALNRTLAMMRDTTLAMKDTTLLSGLIKLQELVDAEMQNTNVIPRDKDAYLEAASAVARNLVIKLEALK